MQNKKIKFTAIIEQAKSNIDAAYIIIPFEVKATFGKLRVKVKATFNGVEYRGTIAIMDKTTGPILVLRKDIRKQMDKSFGDEITVIIEEDKEPRVVILPEDFQNELNKAPKTKEIFDKLAYTHRKEYVNWINDAKKTETGKRRLVKALEMISEGKKYS